MFTTSENIYIFMYFGANQIASKYFSKMIFVPWGIILLVHSSKFCKLKIVQTPGGVVRENYLKSEIIKIFKQEFARLEPRKLPFHSQVKATIIRTRLHTWILFFPLYLELWWLVTTGVRYLWTFSDQDRYYFCGSHKPKILRRRDTSFFVSFL